MQKQGKWKELSRTAAKLWTEHLNSGIPKQQLSNSVILPVPGVSEEDHAWMLAKSLSDWTGIPMEEGLERLSSETQKNKAALERWTIRLAVKVNFTTKNRNFLLVDDVVTTGATVLAAKEALGAGNLISALSLCWREKLRHDS